MKNTLQAGFSRVDITPPLGIPIAGYFEERISDGVLDRLEIQALCLSDSKNKTVIMSADLIYMNTYTLLAIREQVAAVLSIPVSAVFIACTHTHTGPLVSDSLVGEQPKEWNYYLDFLAAQFVSAAILANADLAPAKMGYRTSEAKDIAFIRRFRMKDGSVRTNPGVNNPDILHPIGEVDETVSLVRFARKSGDILLVNFGVHPDTVGGCKISADYPRFVRESLENVLPDTKCIFLNGVQGDVNHVKVDAKGGDGNGLEPTFDGCDRGYDHAKHMGRTIAGAVLGIYGKVHFEDDNEIRFSEGVCKVKSNKADAKDLPLAREYVKLHEQGRDDEIPFTEMELTTVVAEALRMVQMEDEPDFFELPLCAVSVGPVLIFGIPGEPFSGIGKGIKEKSPFRLTINCCTTNGYEGYFPMKEAYDEGGYEARSSRFAAGVAEKIIEDSISIIKVLRI